jgi:hypothetical protein
MAVIVICQWQSDFAAAFFINLSECANLQVEGAFLEFQKASLASSYLSVSPLAWNNSVHVVGIYHEICYLRFFSKLFRENRILIKI